MEIYYAVASNVISAIIFIVIIIVAIKSGRAQKAVSAKWERHFECMKNVVFFSKVTNMDMSKILTDSGILFHDVRLNLQYVRTDGKYMFNTNIAEIKGLIDSGIISRFVLCMTYEYYFSAKDAFSKNPTILDKFCRGIGGHPEWSAWRFEDYTGKTGIIQDVFLRDANDESLHLFLQKKDGENISESESMKRLFCFVEEFSSCADLRNKQLLAALKDKDICARNEIQVILKQYREIEQFKPTNIDALRDAVKEKLAEEKTLQKV